MKAIQLEAAKAFRKIDIGEPNPPEHAEVLVRIHRVGICGTDISGYLGKMPFFSYPRIPGHELGVEVLAVGPAVTNVKPGDLCSVEPYMNCGQCSACKLGNINCCENLKVLGVIIDGGLTERLLLNYCEFAGRLVYVSITQSEVPFPHAPVMHRRKLSIMASRNALPGDFTRIIELIKQGEIDTRPWISHHANFDEMIGVFQSWLKAETGVIKAMVTVN
jgi:threonine dehydrogenase-like Zn-dependent dehydrogenase